MTDLDEKLNALIRHIAEYKEFYLKAFIAETGLKPSECELVTDYSIPNGHVFYVRKREVKE